MNRVIEERNPMTRDVEDAVEIRDEQVETKPAAQMPGVEPRDSSAPREDEQLAALFAADAAEDFRSRWDAVQIGFVDDPKQAVRKADELVGEVLKSLSDTFSGERAKFDADMSAADSAATEHLRVALRRYRSFFQRLLSL
jgi:hypothetical protein